MASALPSAGGIVPFPSFVRHPLCRALTSCGALSALCAPLPAFAWGKLGHELITRTAASLATEGSSFWETHGETLGKLSNVPDQNWKNGRSSSLEKPTHWFEIDAYVDNPADFPKALFDYAKALLQYGESTVTTNGTAIWRVKQLYDEGTAALARGDFEVALQMAGTMAHYVADLSQPLHVTVNYDGPGKGKNGIHKFFETDNLDLVDHVTLSEEVGRRAREQLASGGDFAPGAARDTIAAVYAEVVRSSHDVAGVLETDATEGRTGDGARKQLETAYTRLADGSATLALLLDRMWQESGAQDPGKTFTPSQPEWIKPNFTAKGSGMYSFRGNGGLEEACE